MIYILLLPGWPGPGAAAAAEGDVVEKEDVDVAQQKNLQTRAMCHAAAVVGDEAAVQQEPLGPPPWGPLLRLLPQLMLLTMQHRRQAHHRRHHLVRHAACVWCKSHALLFLCLLNMFYQH